MANLNQKIGFLGAGKMATALARGILEAGLFRADQLFASDVDEGQRKRFEKETGAKTMERNEDIAAACDLAILAVKPNHVIEVLASIRQPFAHRLLISIAAGVSISALEKGLDEKARVIRVMPNTPALVRCGASACAAGQCATDADLALCDAIFGAVGLSFRLPENMLDAVTGLSGSGPAYVFLMLEALSDGGVEMGLPRDVSTRLAIQTVYGAAKLALETGKHPGELREMVTSPGGTTIEALQVLERKGVRAAFKDAVRAATEKSRLLGKK